MTICNKSLQKSTLICRTKVGEIAVSTEKLVELNWKLTTYNENYAEGPQSVFRDAGFSGF